MQQPLSSFFEKLLQAAIKNNLHVQVKVIITETYNMSHTDMSHTDMSHII